MGIGLASAEVLVEASRSGVSFERTLTIGRQVLYASGRELSRLGLPGRRTGEYADELLRMLGASTLDSLDASAYEGATLVHDLNLELPVELEGRYTLVFDGGSLEHVYDMPGALRRCMELVEIGGHYIAASPANNQLGHGFYQVSPEFYRRSFSEQAGWRVRGMFLSERLARRRWYELAAAPASSRQTLRGLAAAELHVVAERVGPARGPGEVPQQGDYEAAWARARRPPLARTARIPDRLRPLLHRAAELRALGRRRAGLQRVPAPRLAGGVGHATETRPP